MGHSIVRDLPWWSQFPLLPLLPSEAWELGPSANSQNCHPNGEEWIGGNDLEGDRKQSLLCTADFIFWYVP